MNHDITFFKNFPMGSTDAAVPRRALQRVQPTQYEGVDTAATFNYTTGVMNDHEVRPHHRCRPNSNRVIQLGVRFRF